MLMCFLQNVLLIQINLQPPNTIVIVTNDNGSVGKYSRTLSDWLIVNIIRTYSSVGNARFVIDIMQIATFVIVPYCGINDITN